MPERRTPKKAAPRKAAAVKGEVTAERAAPMGAGTVPVAVGRASNGTVPALKSTVVTVYSDAAGQNPTTVFTDATGATTSASFTTDANGNYITYGNPFTLIYGKGAGQSVIFPIEFDGALSGYPTDLSDYTDSGATPQATVGLTLNATGTAAAITSPPLPAAVGSPAARWAVKNGTTSTITVTYPNTAGTTVSLTLLPDEVQTFRQKSTCGWGTESGNKPLTQLDLRYDASGAATAAASTEKTRALAAEAGLQPKALVASGLVTATSATVIALLNTVGLGGYTTPPSPALVPMAGDGVTNDQPAFKALVAYLGLAAAATGVSWKLYCPTGTYSIRDAGTVWASGVGLVGDGPGLTVFKLSNPVSTTNPVPLATYTVAGQSAGTTNYLSDCIFSDFSIDGSGVALSSYSTGPKGLGMQFMVRPTFRNLLIQNCGATGLGCDHLVDAVIDNVRCYNNGRLNNGTQAGGAGFGIGTGGWTGTAFKEGGVFTGCVGRGNATHGLFFESQNSAYTLPKGYRVLGGRYEGNQFGISDWGCEGLKVIGCDLLSNLQHGFNVSGASTIVPVAGTGGLLADCVLDGNGIDGACVGDTARYKLVGNRASNNGRDGIHFLNVSTASTAALAAMTTSDNDCYGNGRSGVTADAALSNPFWLSNEARNNGVAAGVAASSSGSSVTYSPFTVTDTAATWVVNSHVGKLVTVGSQTALIASNTATVLTLWPTLSNGATAWGTSGTPAAAAAYSIPGPVANRAGLVVNAALNHPIVRDNRGWDDNGTRIQPYGIFTTSAGVISSGQVSDNDFLGNLTASYLFSGQPSGGTWTNNAGLSAGALASPTVTLTDGPAAMTGYVQVGNGTALGAHLYAGSGAPALSAALGDVYFRTDTPTTANQRQYVCTTAASATTGAWTAVL